MKLSFPVTTLCLTPLGEETLTKSLKILGCGGKVVGLTGPPTPEFARAAGLNPMLRLVFGMLSPKTRALAKKLGVSYEFLLTRASGKQLRQIAELVDTGVIRPIVGAIFPFEQTAQALTSLSKSSIRGRPSSPGPAKPHNWSKAPPHQSRTRGVTPVTASIGIHCSFCPTALRCSRLSMRRTVQIELLFQTHFAR